MNASDKKYRRERVEARRWMAESALLFVTAQLIHS
jgi:hypothetical protein